MKAYVSDTEDLKQDPSCCETWDDMIVNVSELTASIFFTSHCSCIFRGH